MNEFKKKISEQLAKLLGENSSVLAVWEGGSAATGFEDDYSDLDLVIVSEDESVEEIFASLDEFFRENYGIRNRFRMPEPNWHGHAQCFYFLNYGPELFYLDIVVQKRSEGNRLLEPDRHGEAVIWFDRAEIVTAEPTSPEEIRAKNRTMYAYIKNSLDITVIEIQKQIQRHHLTDAMMFYQTLLTRHLGPALNLKYRPEKYDFGIRYAWRAYPPEVTQQLEELLFVKDLPDLKKKARQAETMFRHILDELQETLGEN